MKILRPVLLKLLKVVVRNEQSTREKKLALEIKRLNREHGKVLDKALETVAELKHTISGLNQIIDSREKDITFLEKERDLLQYDVRGLTSINARLTKWVESIRVAEEKPLIEQQLDKNLSEIESAAPWLAT